LAAAEFLAAEILGSKCVLPTVISASIDKNIVEINLNDVEI
jgi:hypothetical protein